VNGKPNRSDSAASSGPFARLTVTGVSPEIDGGRYPAKRLAGDVLVVGADVFKDGHDILAARVRYRPPGEKEWQAAPMTFAPDDDRWTGSFPLNRIGLWEYTVDAWTDRWATWRSELRKKIDAGVDVASELLEGAQLVQAAARRTRFGEPRTALTKAARSLEDTAVAQPARARAALAEDVDALMKQYWAPQDVTSYRHLLRLRVDRPRAGFASWYEFFPRSEGTDGVRHGTFADAEQRLPSIAEMGFDVIYLPPIHPIGRTFRKGRNNTLTPEPDDVGSPWAIGGEEGGHDAIHPQLGTVADFERFVRRANELGMEIALDFALQCSPDHPWVREHPEWFHIRPDGTIKYAENPPKKYQDIYPINFWSEDRANLWNACRDLLLYWIDRGVKTFRVDNPHTKPFSFWEWCIAEVQERHPDVVFLAEAFTRPKKLLELAKLGYTQSYGYFTWKTTKWEIETWMREFLDPEVVEYHRGNMFANTPDILHEYLQHGGMPAFRIRLLLAATLSPIYGIYAGYELGENVPVRPGSEEYLDSEKYQLKARDYEAPGNLGEDIRRLNLIRRSQLALQRFENCHFEVADNVNLLCYRKSAPMRGADDLLVVVNLDPFNMQHGLVHVPLEQLGLNEWDPFVVEDLLTGDRFTWRGRRNYVQIDPRVAPGHLLRIVRGGGA
jgi:starch synthase (maltosyl-transferring)